MCVMRFLCLLRGGKQPRKGAILAEKWQKIRSQKTPLLFYHFCTASPRRSARRCFSSKYRAFAPYYHITILPYCHIVPRVCIYVFACLLLTCHKIRRYGQIFVPLCRPAVLLIWLQYGCMVRGCAYGWRSPFPYVSVGV